MYSNKFLNQIKYIAQFENLKEAQAQISELEELANQLQNQYDEKTNEYIALLQKTQVENEKKSRVVQSNHNVIEFLLNWIETIHQEKSQFEQKIAELQNQIQQLQKKLKEAKNQNFSDQELEKQKQKELVSLKDRELELKEKIEEYNLLIVEIGDRYFLFNKN